MSQPVDRRTFIRGAASLGAVTTSGIAAGSSRATTPMPTTTSGQRDSDANNRVRLGVIGIGNRGTQVSRAFLEHDDVEIVAISDVFHPQMDKAASDLKIATDKYPDFRKLLERDDIDAVLIATPDHWHAIQTIMACQSGKDVYVEKPLSMTIYEGQRMVEVADETQRVVQVGTHRRSSPVWQKAVEMAKSGILGKITMCQAYRNTNMSPTGIGKQQPSTPPNGLDWDMWLGPRAFRPYQDNIAPYKFRWWSDYSSQMGNWGVHYFDVMRWMLNEESPQSICAMGGKYAIDDDRTIPDTAQAMFEFASGTLALFGTYESFGNSMIKKGEFEIRGTNGTLYVDREGIHVLAEKRGQFQTVDPPGKNIDVPIKPANHTDTVAHTRNFLDCIKTRQRPNADVETGHRSTCMSLLANLSLEVGQRLQWDADTNSILQPKTANEQLHYEYREPWKLG